MASVSCRVTMNKFPTVKRAMPIASAKRLKRGAEYGKSVAQMRSRVDTGEMRDGWKVEPDGAGFVLVNDVPHTIFNEYGTARGMTAQPMAHPAADAVNARWPELFAGFEGDLA